MRRVSSSEIGFLRFLEYGELVVWEFWSYRNNVEVLNWEKIEISISFLGKFFEVGSGYRLY